MKCSVCNGDAWKTRSRLTGVQWRRVEALDHIRPGLGCLPHGRISYPTNPLLLSSPPLSQVLDSPLKAWDAYRMAKPVMPSPESMQDPNRAAFWLLQRPALEDGVEMSERDKESVVVGARGTHPLSQCKNPNRAAFCCCSGQQLEDGVEMSERDKESVWWEHEWKQRYEGMREAVLQKQPGWQQAQQALIEMDPSAALNDPELDAAIRTKPPKARRLPKLEGDVEARMAAALEEARKKVEKMTPPPRPKDFGTFQLDWVQEPDPSKVKGGG
ncbi:unnamed protein product [Closterium sp. Yama58-4]|nr:unnamed protein product [Closterium sp. Yama58-4]